MCSPARNVLKSRRLLENAMLFSSIAPDELLTLSRRLDRLINHTLCVRRGSFCRLAMRAVRPRVRNALP